MGGHLCVYKEQKEKRKAKKKSLEKPAVPAVPLYFPTCSLKAAFSLPNLKFVYSAKAEPPSWSQRSTLMVHFLVFCLVRKKILFRPSQWSPEGIGTARGFTFHFSSSHKITSPVGYMLLLRGCPYSKHFSKVRENCFFVNVLP